MRRYLFTALAVAGLAGALAAQAPSRSDAEYLRKAYEVYRDMRQVSPFKDGTWQYVGPKNISGRATDIAVADRQLRCLT